MIAQRKLDFPLTQVVSLLLLGRGKTKFKVFLGLSVFLLNGYSLQADELNIDKKLASCTISRSPRVPAVLFQDFLAAINARFDGECKTLGVLVDDPFSDSNRSLISSDDRFGFWIDSDSSSGTILMRGIDYQSRLYWSQIRTTISASRPLAQDQLTSLVSELLNAFHYKGIISNDHFFSWDTEVGKLAVVKRGSVQRHPFLPFWLQQPAADQVLMKGLSLKKYSKTNIKLQVPDQNTLFSKGDLWLVQDEKNER